MDWRPCSRPGPPAPGSAPRCSPRTRPARRRPPGRRCWSAADTGTAYGRVFDVAQRLGWPPEYGGRALRNAFFERWAGRLDALAADDGAAAELARARDAADLDTAYVYAGQGVGLLAAERSVAEVLADLGRAEALLARWA